jgi:hypothetical protein
VRLPGTARWILLALAGLAIAIGLAIAAANLTSQQIGIASESVSAGDSLAPALHVPGAQKPGNGGEIPGTDEGEETTVPAEPLPGTNEETTPPPEEASEPGGDDYGGSAPDGDD